MSSRPSSTARNTMQRLSRILFSDNSSAPPQTVSSPTTTSTANHHLPQFKSADYATSLPSIVVEESSSSNEEMTTSTITGTAMIVSHHQTTSIISGSGLPSPQPQDDDSERLFCESIKSVIDAVDAMLPVLSRKLEDLKSIKLDNEQRLSEMVRLSDQLTVDLEDIFKINEQLAKKAIVVWKYETSTTSAMDEIAKTLNAAASMIANGGGEPGGRSVKSFINAIKEAKAENIESVNSSESTLIDEDEEVITDEFYDSKQQPVKT